MKKLIAISKSALLWSWLISLPIVLLGGYWAVTATQRYDTFAVRYGSGNVLPSSNRFAEYEFDSIARRAKVFFLSGIYGDSELPVINIQVPQSELTQLNSHLPQSGFEYVEGTIFFDGEPVKMRYRYRGDFAVHWRYHKKSVRIKTGKNALFGGIRTFNLQAPKYDVQVSNLLSYKLAERMGLLVPRAELVSVTLNGERIGTHVFVEQLEEMTLRHRLVMPGDIYRGEIVADDRFLISGYAGKNLFDVPGFWDKMSINNHYPDDHAQPIMEMISLINNPDFDQSQARLTEIMDMEAWGRFSAFESLTNSYHFDNVHNWRIYYDPWRQQLVPIVWDATGWLKNWRFSDPDAHTIAPQSSSRLHEKLFQNGDFIRARNAALSEFFENGGGEEFVEYATDVVDVLLRENRMDPYLRPADADIVRDEARSLIAYIERVMEDGNDYVLPAIDGIDFGRIDSGIRLSVGSTSVVKRVRMLFNESVDPPDRVDVLFSKQSDDGETTNVRTSLDDAVTLTDSEMIIDTEFLPSSVLSDPGLLPRARARTLHHSAGVYDFIFGNGQARPVSIWVDMGQGWQKVPEGEVNERLPFEKLYSPFATPRKTDALVWRGRILISGVEEIDRPLVIEAGTEVVLSEDASLILRNRLDVQGTEDAPVKFVRADGQDLPWGAIAIIGRDADQSRLSHCIVAGGSGYKGAMFEYSGMLSIHDVQDIRVDNCLFKDGTVVDDMVHVVYSSIDFSNSVFDSSFSDALDIDISEARLDNTIFLNSGNDAIDLMSSTASITNSRFVDSGDKGVSVGEGSQLLAVNNIITNNQIGIQVKDGSKAFVYNQTIVGNVEAVDAYKKNWRYNGGGEVYILKSTLVDNGDDVSSDRNSEITVFDSFIDADIPNKRRLRVYASDRENESSAREPDLSLPREMNYTAENMSILDTFDRTALELRDDTRRGAN